jgi:hypothetical protein
MHSSVVLRWPDKSSSNERIYDAGGQIRPRNRDLGLNLFELNLNKLMCLVSAAARTAAVLWGDVGGLMTALQPGECAGHLAPRRPCTLKAIVSKLTAYGGTTPRAELRDGKEAES